MLASIVIPVGPGHERLARRAMQSAEAQTVFCEVVLAPDPEGRGAGWARNQGAARATGELLVFLDADDELLPTFVETCLKNFAVTGRYMYTDWVLAEHGHRQVMRTPYYNPGDLLQRGFFHAVTTLLPRPFFEAVGGFDESLPAWEDNDLYYRLAVRGFCGQRVPAPLLVYHADVGKRRLVGHQRFTELTEEMTRRYGKAKAMGCCGKKYQPVNVPALQGVIPEDWVEVQLVRRGAIAPNGLATGTRYDRASYGSRFWAHPADVAAEHQRRGGPWYTALPLPDRDVAAQVEAIRARVAGVLG